MEGLTAPEEGSWQERGQELTAMLATRYEMASEPGVGRSHVRIAHRGPGSGLRLWQRVRPRGEAVFGAGGGAMASTKAKGGGKIT